MLRLLECQSMRVFRIAGERAAVMPSMNVDVVDLLVRAKNEMPVELFNLDGRAYLRSARLEALKLAAYRTLTTVNSLSASR